MNSEPWARLIRFMMPNTRVSPDAISSSVTPNCRPFSICSRNSCIHLISGTGGLRRRRPPQTPDRLLQAALGSVGILVIVEDLGDHDIGELAVVAAHHLADIDVLNRMVIIAEAEVATHRIELGRPQRRAELVRLRQ